MPAILREYDPNDRHVNEAGDVERAERTALINTLHAWRDGDHPDTLDVEPGRRNDNIKINLCGQMVEDIVDFCGLPDMEIAGGVDNVAAGGNLATVVSREQQEQHSGNEELPCITKLRR